MGSARLHLPTPLPQEGNLRLPPPTTWAMQICAKLPPTPGFGDGGPCLPPRAAGCSSPTLITLIFPPTSQCLDGIDYGDFDFTSHMMEQKEPLMETGKGPSGFALPRYRAAVGFPTG